MSENGFEDKISALLSNPEALAGIMNIAKGLGLQQSVPKEEIKNSTADTSVIAAPVFNQFEHDSHHGTSKGFKGLELLLAIKPFLDNERASRLDKITQILKIISYTDLFR